MTGAILKKVQSKIDFPMLRFFGKHVPLSETASFTSHLAEFLSAGVPLLNAVEMLEKENPRPYFRNVLRDLVARVRAGDSFSAALKRTPAIFSPFYVSLVQAGEAGGKLESVLERLSLALEKEIDLRNKVGQALAYPALVLAFGIFTVLFLMIVIVPKISVIYTEFGGTFPPLTRVILGLSAFLLHFGWIFLLIFAGGFFYLAGHDRGRELKKISDRISFSIPWIRSLVLQAEIARFSRTLAILLESGVTLLQALALSVNTLTNGISRAKLSGLEKTVSQGQGFSEALRQRNFFPELALNFIRVGESTGNLDKSLEKLGAIAEKEVDRQMRIVTTLLEPMVIIVVGIVVAVIVVSLLMPIFEMSLLVR